MKEISRENLALMDKYIDDFCNSTFIGSCTDYTRYIFHLIYGEFDENYRYSIINSYGTFEQLLSSANRDYTINVIYRSKSTIEEADARAFNDHGYEFNAILTKYIRKTWRTVSIYTDPARHRAAIVSGKTVSPMQLNTILMSISEKLYNVTLSEDKHNLLRALGNTEEHHILDDAIENWIENVIKTKVHIDTVGELFAKFIQKNRKNRAKDLQMDIERLSEQIRRIEEEYQGILDAIDSKSRDYEAALKTSKEQVNDLQKFIDANKAIYNVTANAAGDISFFVKTFLTNFDNYAVDAMLSNRNSYINQQWAAQYPDFIDFIRYVFGKNKLGKLRVCSEYVISNNCVRVQARCNLDDDCVGNAHHYYFACLGSNNLELDKYFRNGDFESMFEYAIACTSTENVNEAASFNRLLESFLTTWKNKKCVEYKGEDYTWPNFVKKVKDEQSNSEQ